MALVEIPYRVVPDFSDEDLLARIREITDSETLGKKRVGIFGCGSLGSGFASGISGSGIIDYIAADMEALSVVNVIRHIGTINDLGKDKTEIFRDYIHSHQPLARVQTVNDDLIKNRKLLRAIIESVDLVAATSGNPELNYHINSICVELKKPVAFGGIFEGAKSAYVFYYSGKEEACCFDCVFGLTTSAIDQNTIKRKYGLSDGELKGAQGHYTNIAIPGLMMAKVALNLLLDKEMRYNLIRYYDENRVDRLNVSRKKLCATCDYGNWLKREEEKLKEKVGTEQSSSFIKKLFFELRERLKLARR